VIAGMILGSILGRVIRHGVPYVTQARWRAGPLGTQVPRAPGRLPSPNPILSAGAAPNARVRRASRLRNASRRR
jgi:hypothetical protein